MRTATLQHCNTATASAESELASAMPSARSLDEVNTATASAESELASAMPSACSLDEVNTATKCVNLIRKKNQKKLAKHS